MNFHILSYTCTIVVFFFLELDHIYVILVSFLYKIQKHSSVVLHLSKGFDKNAAKKTETKKQKSEGQLQRETMSTKYDEISKLGGQEYNVFVRQFGSSDQSWLPCGAIAVPRGGQVSDAIFANEVELQKAIVRIFPKLKGYEQEFEYGFNLKVYPDDPIEVAAKRNGPRPTGFSVGNWINTLLSPVDASGTTTNPPKN